MKQSGIRSYTEMTRRGVVIADVLDMHLKIGAHRHDPIQAEEVKWDLSQEVGGVVIKMVINITSDIKDILERLVLKHPRASHSTILNTSLGIYLDLVEFWEAGYCLTIFDAEGEATGLGLL